MTAWAHCQRQVAFLHFVTAQILQYAVQSNNTVQLAYDTTIVNWFKKENQSHVCMSLVQSTENKLLLN